MRPGTTPHCVSLLLPFPPSGITSQNGDSEVVSAGVAKDGSFSWVVRESILDVVDNKTQQRLASWNFGAVISDNHTYIGCVKEFDYGRTPKLIVGVGNASNRGMVCVLDASLSKVLKAIDIPHKITSIEVVTKHGGDEAPSWALNTQLRLFHGIVAVGTHGGIVYLIDMCLDDEGEISDEVSPARLQFISPRMRDTAERRKQAISRGQHLSMVLDEEAQGNGYRYRRCDGQTLRTFDTDEVLVSCLKYIPQTGSLVVGFSFGSFQIWKLSIPVLEYSSHLESDPVPITHIIYQEPENDPKNFSYVWVSHSTGDLEDDCLASASLYQLSYNKKTWYSNYGPFFEDLQSICPRFAMDLLSSPLNPETQGCTSSRIITAYTLEDPAYRAPSKLGDEESFEECMSLHGPDLSLSVFVWETSDGVTPGTSAHMALFDMNRWYHAQMPSKIRKVVGKMDTCPYFCFLSLDEVLDQGESDNLLTVHVGVDKLRRFRNLSPLPPEQYYYPAALAFHTAAIMDTGMVKAEYLGTQRQVLATMLKKGPSMLLNPRELYNLCVFVGLLPRILDSASQNPSRKEMREALLSMALDYNMLPFIVSCIMEWAAREYVHLDCTLRTLLDWAWDRAAHTKNTIDSTCIPLYDFSGIPLDQRSLQVLHQSNQRLLNIKAILRCLMDQSSPVTDQGQNELQSKLSVVSYIQQHLHMVVWFVSAGLLPEHDDTEDLLPHQYSYPVGNLCHAYRLRRQELQKINSELGATDILMIDGLLERAGEGVKNLWDREGGSGMYPPPSFHALLNIYLLEEPDLMTKHLIVLYVLLDLVSLAQTDVHEKFAEKINRFTRAFSIPASLVKQVQAFWLLDHKDFEESIAIILDPMVTEVVGPWQHCRIVKSYLYQGEPKLAIRYLNTVRPPLSTPEEVKLKLTVLLANRLVSEALEYQRTCRDVASVQDLLTHLFKGCQQVQVMDQLLQLPLYDIEEEQLISFLTESSEYHLLELLVLHYLQRARYAEAIQLNDRLKRMSMNEMNSKARERAAARNAIVDGFMSVLTAVQRKVISEGQHLPKRVSIKRREVRRPQPLSTTVTRSSLVSEKSRSGLYREVMDRVQQIAQDTESTPDHGQQSSPSKQMFDASFSTLLGTPRTSCVKSYMQPQPVMYPESVYSVTSPLSVVKKSLPISDHKGMGVLQSPRVTSKITSAEALSLLKTPDVKRRTPNTARKSVSAIPTPQSILKVRRLISASPSPASQPTSANTTETELLRDKIPHSPYSAVPTRLKLNESVAPPSPRSVSFSQTTPSSHTPKKHLRFAAADATSNETPKRTRFAMSDQSPDSLSTAVPGGSPESPMQVTFTELKDRLPTKSSEVNRPPPEKQVKDNLEAQKKITPSPQKRSPSRPVQATLTEVVAMETNAVEEPMARLVKDTEFNNTADHAAVEGMDVGDRVTPPSMDRSHSAIPSTVEIPDTSSPSLPGSVLSAPEDYLGYNPPPTSTLPSPSTSTLPSPPARRSPGRKVLSHFRSPRKPPDSTPRSPTVKLSRGRGKDRPVFGLGPDDKGSSEEEQVTSTTDVDSPFIDANKTVEIDLTLDEDSEADEVMEREKKERKTSEFSFAPPSSSGVVEESLEKGGVFKLRRKPTFTFSPPVPVSRIKRSESKTSKMDMSPLSQSVRREDKVQRGRTRSEKKSVLPQKFDIDALQSEDLTNPRRSRRIYDSLATPTSAVAMVTTTTTPYRTSKAVYNSLVGSDSEIKLEMPKMIVSPATLKSVTKALKSPPSAERLKREPSKSGSRKTPKGKDEKLNQSFERRSKVEKGKMSKKPSSASLSSNDSRSEKSRMSRKRNSSSLSLDDSKADKSRMSRNQNSSSFSLDDSKAENSRLPKKPSSASLSSHDSRAGKGRMPKKPSSSSVSLEDSIVEKTTMSKKPSSSSLSSLDRKVRSTPTVKTSSTVKLGRREKKTSMSEQTPAVDRKEEMFPTTSRKDSSRAKKLSESEPSAKEPPSVQREDKSPVRGRRGRPSRVDTSDSDKERSSTRKSVTPSPRMQTRSSSRSLSPQTKDSTCHFCDESTSPSSRKSRSPETDARKDKSRKGTRSSVKERMKTRSSSSSVSPVRDVFPDEHTETKSMRKSPGRQKKTPKSPGRQRKGRDSETQDSPTKTRHSLSRSPHREEEASVVVPSSTGRSPGRPKKVKDADVTETPRKTRAGSRTKSPKTDAVMVETPRKTRAGSRAKSPEKDAVMVETPRKTRAGSRAKSPEKDAVMVETPRKTRAGSRAKSPEKDTDVSSAVPKSPARSPGRPRKPQDAAEAEKLRETVESLRKTRTGSHSESPVKSGLKETDTSITSAKSPGRGRRRGRKPAGEEVMDTDLSSTDTDTTQSKRSTRNAPMTPTRRSSRLQKEDVEEALLLSQSLTPTRRTRKKKKEEQEPTKDNKGKTTDATEESEGMMSEHENPEPMEEDDEPKEKIPRRDSEHEDMSPSSPYQFSEPEEVDAGDADEEHFSPTQSFIFSPPLTRGLSKRLSVEPGEQTSLSRRLSLNPEALTAGSSKARRRSQEPRAGTKDLDVDTQDSELMPPPSLSPRLEVTPRPPIHRRRRSQGTEEGEKEADKSRSGRRRQTRSETPETVAELPTIEERAVSEPPEKMKTRTRRAKKKEYDEVMLIPLPEKPDTEGNTTPEDTKAPDTEAPDTIEQGASTRRIKPVYRRKKRVAKLY